MGHTSFVSSLDWSIDSQHLRSNSVDHELLFWNAGVCRALRDVEAIRELTWASHDCPISWGTLGVWGESPDAPDVASTCRNHDRELLAAGDSAGRVRLYTFPASQPKSLCHSHSGHSSGVTRVAWLTDSSKLISAGGRDNTLLQWSVV